MRALLAVLAALLFGAVAFAQVLPSWAYHSTIPAKQRITDYHKLLKLLEAKGKKNRKYLHAADYMEQRLSVGEPLGADSSGAEAVRIIETSKSKDGKDDGCVVPIYAADAKAGGTVAELIHMKKYAVGLDTDAPVIYIRMDRLDAKDALQMIEMNVEQFQKQLKEADKNKAAP